MKIKLSKIKRYNDGDTYVFVNGVAKVPGMRSKSGPYMITLKEFNEITKGVDDKQFPAEEGW